MEGKVNIYAKWRGEETGGDREIIKVKLEENF